MPTQCPAIEQGYTRGCRDAQGGVKKFYITEHANISSYTEASGVITAMTMVSGKKFWLYEQELNTANATEVTTSSRVNGTTFVEQTFNCALNKRSASVSYSIRALAHQDVAIIVVEQTGTMYLFGALNGLALETATSNTGTAAADRNGYDLVFKGQEKIKAGTVSSAILTTVTTA